MSYATRISASLGGAVLIAALIVLLAWLIVAMQRGIAEEDRRTFRPDEVPPVEGSAFDHSG